MHFKQPGMNRTACKRSIVDVSKATQDRSKVTCVRCKEWLVRKQKQDEWERSREQDIVDDQVAGPYGTGRRRKLPTGGTQMETKQAISDALLERFGEPIGDAPARIGVPDQREGDDEKPCCDQCGHMMPMEGLTCEGCGKLRTL